MTDELLRHFYRETCPPSSLLALLLLDGQLALTVLSTPQSASMRGSTSSTTTSPSRSLVWRCVLDRASPLPGRRVAGRLTLRPPSSQASREDDTLNVGQIMGELFERLLSWQQAWAVPLAAFEQSVPSRASTARCAHADARTAGPSPAASPPLRSRFTLYFVQTLHLRLPLSFPDHMHRFFALSFAAFASSADAGSASPVHPFESPANPHASLPPPRAPSQSLHRLGMLARFGPEITSVAFRAIEGRVAEDCAGEWEERKLDGLRQWGRRVVSGWWEQFYLGLCTPFDRLVLALAQLTLAPTSSPQARTT